MTTSGRKSYDDTHGKNNQEIKYLKEKDSEMTRLLKLINRIFKIMMLIILKPLIIKMTTFP